MYPPPHITLTNARSVYRSSVFITVGAVYNCGGCL